MIIEKEINKKIRERLFKIGFFQLAHNLSKYSEMWPAVGAVIVKKKPIGVGYNSLKTHKYFSVPFYNGSVPRRIHAEVQAIITTRFVTSLKGATMYVYRETDDGKPALARPCEQCMWSLKEYGFKDVFYTINEYPYWRREKIR